MFSIASRTSFTLWRPPVVQWSPCVTRSRSDQRLNSYAEYDIALAVYSFCHRPRSCLQKDATLSFWNLCRSNRKLGFLLVFHVIASGKAPPPRQLGNLRHRRILAESLPSSNRWMPVFGASQKIPNLAVHLPARRALTDMSSLEHCTLPRAPN